MDVISHGLWGSIAFGRKNRRSFWLAFAFGVLPDLLAFAPFTIGLLLGITEREWAFGEPPNPEAFPSYIYSAYNYSHSLVIFVLLFLGLWVIFRRPIWEFSAWGLNIIMDIPTHSLEFFPTPFLWPIADVHVDGRTWGDPVIFIPNVILLVTLYAWFYWIRAPWRVQNKK